MNDRLVGRLASVDLRTIWSSEAGDFTPWLSRSENLEYLADILGVELELEAQEKFVGPFRADILCKDIGNNSWVLIENQLEKTNHLHLGQLLTYAAGLQAVTIVWVAANFREEHRATLDWLNSITDKSFRFFGIEVELWKIENSPVAPKFNVVSKPNDWSQSAAQAARDTELSATKLMQKEYWATFHPVLDAANGPISGTTSSRTPPPSPWIDYGIGRRGFTLRAAISCQKNRIRTDLVIYGDDAEAHFHLLKQQKDAVEKRLGYELDWEELPKRQQCRISSYLNSTNTEDKSDWPRQHEWLAERLNSMHSAFSQLVKNLNSDDWIGEDE